MIGYADLANVSGDTAEFGFATGESSLWGKGIGFKASLCMIEYAITHLGITNFNAETHERNIRARKMLEKIGFEEVSRIGNGQYLGKDCQLVQYRFSL